MPKFDAEALAEMAVMIEEMLNGAGFTGVKVAPATLPEAAIKAFGDEFDDEDVDPASQEFAQELGYHRVATDQGEFGVWFEPYVILDISGLGLDAAAFFPPGTSADEIPEDWSFIGLDEGVPERLFIELTKKRRQP